MKDINKTEKQPVKKQIAEPDLDTHTVRALPKIFSNPFYVIIVTVISLFLAETFVMIVSSNLPALPLYERALIDALLLVIVAFPAFYLFLFKPIRSCIAEYRQTEENLLKEKNFSEMVINSLPGVFYLFDHEGEPRKWNRNAEIVTGYSAEEIKKMKPTDFFEGDDKKLITEKIREVFDKGESNAEADLVSKSGKKIRYYFNGHRLIMNSKQYFAGMGVDITELKNTEEELLEVHREWENIFQAIGHPTVILDPEHNILFANKATVTATGLPLEGVVGKKCYEIFHGTGRPPDGCPFEKMLHSGKLETEVMEVEALDGIYLVSSTPVLDDEGRLQKVIHIAADITGLKRAENIINIQHDLAVDLSGTRDLKEALSLLLDTATILEGMDCGGIYMFEPVSATLDLVVSKGLSPECTEQVSHYSRDTDNVRFVMRGKPVYMEYSELEIPKSDAERSEGLLSIAIIPIIYRDQLVACMNIASHTLKGIPVITKNALETIASQVGSVIARLKAEEALRKSHSLLTSLVESPSDIIILSVDKDYNYTFFNTIHEKEMKKVWGVDIEIGGNLIGYMPSEEERDKVRNNFEHVLNGESFTKTEWYGEPGNRFWYELAYNPIFDESNNVNGITVFIKDITERKKIEESLRLSELQFKGIFNNSNDGILIADTGEKKFIMANPKISQMLGYSVDELKNMSVMDIHPEKDIPMIVNEFEKMAKSEKSIIENVPVKRKDGSILYADISSFQLEIAEKNYLAGVFRDVTERRQTEEAVLNIATGVSATVGKKFFYSIAEHLTKILKADYAYVAEIIKEVPNTVMTLALYADGKFIDNIKVDLAGTPCETVKEKLCSYPSGVQKLFPHAEMMAMMNVEGYIGTPLFGSNGEWLGLMSVMYRKPIENVSVVKSMLQIFATRAAAELERRQSEEELKKANKEIEAWSKELERRVKEKTEELVSSQTQLNQAEKLSAMGRMAGGLAHELNSPLAGLLPLIEKYQRKAKKGSEAYTELSLMFKAAVHMAKIIKDFGAFSRESTGVFIRIDLKQVLEDTLSFSAVSLRQRGIRIIRKYERRLPEVQGEKTELQQVVLNMVANACDAMPEGGKFIIKTGLANDGSNVIMEFIDNGVGIEKENLGRIFDPFYTTKKPGEGTGLGLSITYGIIKKHNGEISVESKPGKGTKFKVVLPAVKAHER